MSGAPDEDDRLQIQPREEDDTSFAAWVMVGCGLVLAYVLALALLHPTT